MDKTRALPLCELVHEAPQVYRVRVPLPGSALREVNSYVVRDGADALVIDTGFDDPVCMQALTAALAELGIREGDARLLVTHAHADHCGLAGRLGFAATYVHEDAHTVMRDVASGAWNKIQAASMAEMGFSPTDGEAILRESPSATETNHFEFEPTIVEHGDVIRVGAYALQCLHTPGHAPGHTCLYLPERKLLFTGDHILFDISPNIAHWSISDDPLAEYLENLRAVRDVPVALALPGHREPRHDIAWRVDELIHHHDLRLQECLNAVASRDGQVACDIARGISWARGRRFDDMNYTQRLFAAGEARAHVEHLVRMGKVSREQDGALVRYTARG